MSPGRRAPAGALVGLRSGGGGRAGARIRERAHRALLADGHRVRRVLAVCIPRLAAAAVAALRARATQFAWRVLQKSSMCCTHMR